MKSAVLAVAAGSLVGSAVAGRMHEAHANFHHRRAALATGYSNGSCTAYTSYVTGAPTWIPQPPPSSTEVLPTPKVTVCPTPGVYTFPAETITVTDTTTVCGAASTVLSSGVYTIGGVTTVVPGSTTITVPYATLSTTGYLTSSVISTTTYVCPSAGTYTIAPETVTVTETETTYVYPTPTSLVPGTYTASAATVTITKTSEVYVCPFETSTPTPTPTPSSSEAATSSAAPVVSAIPTKAAYSAAAYVPSVAAVSVAHPKASHAASSSSSGSITTNGNQWAMTYTPYDSQGGCKTQAAIEADIASIKAKGFAAIRVYSTDCSTVEFVLPAIKANGLKVILGVWLDNRGIGYAEQQAEALIAWGEWSIVDMIVVGNEVIFQGWATEQTLISFVSDCKSKFRAAGYNGIVTTTEPLDIVQEHPNICSVMDVASANVHALFTSSVFPWMAGEFVKGQLALLAAACPEAAKNGVYNLESGWAHAGSNNGDAYVSKQYQQTAIQNIVDVVGKQTVIFSFSDDHWKAPGPYGWEQNFGCADIFPDKY